MTLKPYHYPYVTAYYELTGLQDYHIRDYVRLAQGDGAPRDAAFRTREGKWGKLSDCAPVIREQMLARVRL